MDGEEKPGRYLMEEFDTRELLQAGCRAGLFCWRCGVFAEEGGRAVLRGGRSCGREQSFLTCAASRGSGGRDVDCSLCVAGWLA